MPIPGVLHSHPILTIWTVVVVILITVVLRTGFTGLFPFVVVGATALLILALTQAWIVDTMKLRRQRTSETDSTQ